MRRRALALVLATLLALASGLPSTVADEQPVAEDHVILKSGHVMAGRVVGTEKVHGKAVLVVDTPFGTTRVPKPEVEKAVEAEVAPDATYRIRRIRVVRIEGKVERKSARGTAWSLLSWKATDRYGRPIVNAPNAIIRPGDTIRTGKDGILDFQPSKDVWIRVAKSSEIVIPAADDREAPSLELKKGSSLADVSGRPRGQRFRVRTPLSLLSTRDGAFRASKEGAQALRGAVSQDGKPLAVVSDAEKYGLSVVPRLVRDDLVFVSAGEYEVGGGLTRGDAKGILQKARRGHVAGGAKLSWRALAKLSSSLESQRVSVPEFLIDRVEVTNEAYLAFLIATDRVTDFQRTYFPNQGLDRPVRTQWLNARDFAAWRGVRLPTEMEWEIAARGAGARLFPWGSSVDPLPSSPSGLRPIYTQAVSSGLEDGPLDGPTPDVSPWGVRRLVTGYPEWTSSRFGSSPLDEHDGIWRVIADDPEFEDRPGVRAGRIDGAPVARGQFGSTRWRTPIILATCAFRCVVELDD